MSTTMHDENPELSPSSPLEDSDTAFPAAIEPEPNPGLDGVPVRCKLARPHSPSI
jgi:phosphatidylserine synthase 2